MSYKASDMSQRAHPSRLGIATADAENDTIYATSLRLSEDDRRACVVLHKDYSYALAVFTCPQRHI